MMLLTVKVIGFALIFLVLAELAGETLAIVRNSRGRRQQPLFDYSGRAVPTRRSTAGMLSTGAVGLVVLLVTILIARVTCIL